MPSSHRRCATVVLITLLALIWHVKAEVLAPVTNTNVSAVLTSGYRLYVTTTASDHIHGFMYTTNMFDKRLQFGICVTREFPFCTDTSLCVLLGIDIFQCPPIFQYPYNSLAYRHITNGFYARPDAGESKQIIR